MRLNKINVEFKIYRTAALQRDNILLTEKRERNKEIHETTVDHKLQAGKLYYRPHAVNLSVFRGMGYFLM